MFEWITDLIARGGYLAYGWLMFVETVFPPIPSEVLVPLAGFLAAEGTFRLIPVIAVGTFGSTLGAVFWYWVGLRVGERRLRKLAGKYGRWFTVSPEDVDKTGKWFRKRGLWAVFLARMLPGPRSMISVPAGVARMTFLPFLVATTAGTALWISFLAILGYVLQAQYDRIADYLDPILYAMVALGLGYYVWRLIRQMSAR
ncbi:alkaline phosphatase [Jannaschia pagri]|uniref:Alkaline phosphatase n=1 Tax=Jannaschia pagri TaxID=2829797 RepID=A0ABQ4NPW9_9RHOB|nr:MULTISPECIES: DedA family protein [unclassified Jannaschia]GIT92688.1 alkaline phosphatase [Jannaschia sp. AI_61]GIT96452.1 alkaline phosphatase [Jannaschia sp. AI_62]